MLSYTNSCVLGIMLPVENAADTEYIAVSVQWNWSFVSFSVKKMLNVQYILYALDGVIEICIIQTHKLM